MRVTWEVDDGYAGKSRPQHLDISDEEFEECTTEEDKQVLIEDFVQEDFDNRITFHIIRIEENV